MKMMDERSMDGMIFEERSIKEQQENDKKKTWQNEINKKSKKVKLWTKIIYIHT